MKAALAKAPAPIGYMPTANSSGSGRRLIGRATERRGKMIAFGYYGGKFSHLDFILPLLPQRHSHYCEPFGGSAAVLINRAPAEVETYVDVEGEVVFVASIAQRQRTQYHSIFPS